MIAPLLSLALSLSLSPVACRRDAPSPAAGAPSPLLDVTETAGWSIPGLHGEAYVLWTEAGIPYVYAEDREDLARAVGFVVARDRFFMIDLMRRLAQGRVSELLGDAGLATDQESRGTGMTRVTDQLLARLDADPEWAAIADAYAAGVTAYVDLAKAGELPLPSELEVLGPVLAGGDPTALLVGWERRDVAAVGATLIYNLGFEGGDVDRAEAWAALPGLFAGDPLEAERTAGAVADVFQLVTPVHPLSSAPAPADGARRRAPPPASGGGSAGPVPREVLGRLRERIGRIERRFGRDRDAGYGSNAWAVAGAATADGRTLLAGDGHLALSVPPLFYQIGMDTAHLGGGDVHQVGLVLPGFPTLAVGTNGDVAWSQTQLFGDITDWYREELQLDGDGRPAATRFQGRWEPLVVVDETYEVADVPLLDSVGRTVTTRRYETFDGRPIAAIEGPDAADAEPGPGEAVVNVLGQDVIPRDIDGDGTITAISFDYVAFDPGNLIVASDGFGRATDVASFREVTRKLVAYSQNIVASDRYGDILYTGYQAVPCRTYLPRDAGGRFVEGADPTLLLDGTRYGGFTVPVADDGTIDESHADDPVRCVVPFDASPQVVTPPEGFVVTANHDPGGLSLDGDLFDDPYYLGGPWEPGFRAERIDALLRAEVEAGTADIAAMSRIQGDHRSNLAAVLLPELVAAFDAARSADPDGDPAEARLAALWTADEARFREVEDCLRAWQAVGLQARAGVETFYQEVASGDAGNAVATMLWNAWIGEFAKRVLEDEGFGAVWAPSGDYGRSRTLVRMLRGRGAENPLGLASWVEATGESAFFDVRGTEPIETSHEVALQALTAALDRLTAPSPGPGLGGFGTPDMAHWLWGTRHLVRFESLLAEVLGEDDAFGFVVDLFSITPDELPLADDLPVGDPRRGLPGFPRHGDQFAVDAANPGLTETEDWSYTSGPVFRMVIALGPDGAEGVNVLPGGQSALSDSPHYADQAALWLGNETLPLHTTVEAVIAAATGRETLTR